MSTYYGYAEREAEDNINWSVVGSDITKMLQEEVTRRETLKKDLDDASREYGQTLSEAPTGTHRGANNFITGFAGDASQARLMQDRMLKTGQLKVKDYLLQRANLTDGTKGIFNVAKNFQKEFKRKADRMTKDESAKFEQTLFKMTEGFANFNSSGAYINPTDFRVSIAKKERVKGKDGNYVYKMGDKPQDFFTVNELNTFVSLDMDRFKTSEALDAIAKRAGARNLELRIYDKETDSFINKLISDSTGEVMKKNLSADQLKLVNDYENQVNKELDNILANPYDAASILTDYIGSEEGKEYDFTFDPNEAKADPTKILMEKDPGGSGLPRLAISQGQDGVIREALKEGIRFRLAQTYSEKGVEKKKFAPWKPSTDPAIRRKEKTTNEKIKNSIFLSDLIYGNDKEKSEALNRLKGLNRKVVKQYNFVETNEKDEQGNPIVNLSVDVFDKGTQEGFISQEVITDFNNKNVNEIVRALILDDITNITNQDDRKHYSDNMASVILNNYGDFGLKKSRLVPAGRDVKSGRTAAPTIPWADRQVVSTKGVTGNPQLVFTSQAKNVTTGDSKALQQAWEVSYLQTPSGESSEVVPLSGVATVVPLTADDVIQNHGINSGNAYGTLKINLDPEYSEEDYILIPVWSTTASASNKVAQYMDEIATDIKSGKSDKKIKKEDIRKFFSETRTFGKDDIEWFDMYNPPQAEAETSQTSSGTQAPFRAYDPNEFPSFPDYKAAKDAYEKKK